MGASETVSKHAALRSSKIAFAAVNPSCASHKKSIKHCSTVTGHNKRLPLP